MIFNLLKESSWINPQIDCLLSLQTAREAANPFFTQFFLFITKFGEIIIPLLFICGIYWCIDNKKGIYLILLSGYSLLLNQFLKMAACVYRPWVINPGIKPPYAALEMAHGYSFPSGHSAKAMSVWGACAFLFWKNKLIRYIMIALVLLVAFSRNYLGVHTPQDVIVSLLVAFVLLFLVHYLIVWVDGGKNRDIIVFLTTCILILAVVAFVFVKTYPIDYLNGEILVNPYKIKISVLTNSGYNFGVFTGWLLCRRFLDFDASQGTIVEKIIRFLAGIAILVLLSFSFDFLKQFTGAYIDFVNNFVCAIFVIFLYPLLLKLGGFLKLPLQDV